MDLTSHLIFAGLVGAALVVDRIPIINKPFLWFEVYFHELAHGLVTLFTGGDFVRLELHWNGGGRCYSRGGWIFVSLLFGYIGASIFGGLIYLMGLRLGTGASRYIVVGLVTVILLSAAALARDLTTVLILLILALILSVPFMYLQSEILPLLLQLVGLAVALHACRSPLHLIDGKLVGDGAELQKLTYIPEGFWIGLWIAFGLATVFFMWQFRLPAGARLLVLPI